jgi:predicted acetyltransferase
MPWDPVGVSPPSVEHRAAFQAMLADFDAHGGYNRELYEPATSDFTAYVRRLLEEERGLGLRSGWVPCTHRWLLLPTGAMVGVARLRHRIDTPFLSQDGGHIGYEVAPSHRGRGYGHAALRAALVEAERLGLRRVLLITGEDNIASRAIIVQQGGVLESIACSDFWRERVCRYWITVAAR